MDYKYINPEYLDSVSAGDIGIISELVSMFRDQSVEIHNEMKQLLERQDYHALSLLAHKAKSSVLIMGMNDLGTLLKTFELQAKEGKEVEKYESYISRFGADTTEAVKELDRMVNDRKNQK